MDLLTKILLTLVGTGFLGNLLLYRFKRRDSINDRDKELLNPIIDEVCKVCHSAETIINKSNMISKKLDDLYKKQFQLFKDAEAEMRQYDILQNELMSIYSKTEITTPDRINIQLIRQQEDGCLRKRFEIMEEALAIPKEEQKTISEFNIEIKQEISPYNGLTHRLTNIYKFSNKRTSRIVGQQLTKIDNILKKIIDNCESYPILQLSPPLLFHLFKMATDCRLKLTQLNG